MRPWRIGGALVLVGAALAAAGAPAALAASRTVTLEGWHARVMAFSGGRLVWTEAATARVDPARTAGAPAGARRFDYYRAEASTVALNRASSRFVGDVETPVAVRTSIASMTPGALAPTGDGGFVTVPGARRFAPPVILCCTPDGVETVIESDGRAEAPPTVAATWAGGVTRYVQLAPGGWVLRLAGPPPGAVPESRPAAGATAAGLVAVSARAVAWVDPAAPATLVVQADGAPPAPLSLPGPALRVWGAQGLFAVAVRVGARVVLLRVDDVATPQAVRVWTGAAVPRVALGGGSVAIAQGRRVLAARFGALRPVVRGRRPIDAVAVDGRRLAWVERGTRRGARVGVVRLGRVS